MPMQKVLLVASMIFLALLTSFYTYTDEKTDAFEEWKGTYGVDWNP